MRITERIYRKIVRKIYNIISKDLEQPSKFDWDAFIGNPYSRYDLQTFFIIKKVLKKDSNVIDIGAHVGEVLEKMIDATPFGMHFAFEPLPHLYVRLTEKFGDVAKVYPYALTNQSGTSTFNYVTSNPYYSGLLTQKYPSDETIKIINVDVRRLDEVIPNDLPIHFIKIDVEGAEYLVLKGAEKILEKYKPIIIYEQGLGSAEFYGTTPDSFYDFMTSFGYNLSLMDYYISNLEPLTKDEYCNQFNKRYNYYFIAY